MLKKFLAVVLSLSLVAGVVGCSSEKSGRKLTKDTVEDKGLEEIGTTVKFNPNKLVNDGEPISIDFWIWGSENTFKKAVDGYMDIYPNVEIKLVNNPWEDYWTKLPLQLKGKNGPALFNVHNSHHDNIIQYMAPYDIPLEELEADFTGVPAHVIDGEVYYIDYGIMTGSIYYNKDMWQAAGLTEGDIPKTWEDFAEVAKKLTIKEGNEFKQAGFNFNNEYHSLILGLNYQYGQHIFEEDGVTATINNDAIKNGTELLIDFYDKHEVGSKDFGVSGTESFGQGQTAMVTAWGHFYQTLKEKYPDINFGVFEIPSVTEDKPYAYNRYNGESTFGINKNADEKEQAVAQDFMRYFLANDEAQKEFIMELSVFPGKKTLAEDPEILEHPAMNAVAENIDRYIWPGPIPATFESSMKKAGEDIMFNGVSVEAALKEAEEKINRDLKNTKFQSVENLYEHAE